jgi:hypothetical protein
LQEQLTDSGENINGIDLYNMLKEINFDINMNANSLPLNDKTSSYMYISMHDSEYNSVQFENDIVNSRSLYSPNTYKLVTTSAYRTELIKSKTNIVDNNNKEYHNYGIHYTWIVHQPLLLQSSDKLYVSVSPSIFNNVNDSNYEYEISTNIIMKLCSDNNFCVHGECVVVEGDIRVATCSCRYFHYHC